jgi:hypothetical protein
LTHRSSVDLPDPDAPMSTVTVCSGTARDDVAQHQLVAEALAHVLELEDRQGAHAPSCAF